MGTTVVVVKGMSCEACVRSVTNGLGRLPGVKRVEVELRTGRVSVTHEGPAPTESALRTALDDLGYDFGGMG